MATFDAAVSLLPQATATVVGRNKVATQSQLFGVCALTTTEAGAIRHGSASLEGHSFVEAEAAVWRRKEAGADIYAACTISASVWRERAFTMSASLAAESTMTLRPCPSMVSMSVGDAIDAIKNVWGYSCSDRNSNCADDPMAEEAEQFLNSAFQKLCASSRGHEFLSVGFNDTDWSLLGDPWSGGSIDLLQYGTKPFAIVGPVTLTVVLDDVTYVDRLRPIGNRREADAIDLEYADHLFPFEDEGAYVTRPVGYYVNKSDIQFGMLPSSMQLELHPPFRCTVAWPNNVAPVLGYNALYSPKRFSCCSRLERLPITHYHAESLLIPLARWYATTSRYFQRAELIPQIKEQATEALKLLGEYHGQPKEVDNRKA